MTQRLYYDDAYLTRFTARVSERLEHEGQPAVVLDRTAFYPTSGGQPFDRGVLGDVAVVDVLVRESDDAILHVLDTPLPGPSTVTGAIDWERRFDHMQQHTGQHILSQAFVQIAQAETVGFHLGVESATIDLAGLLRSTGRQSRDSQVGEWMDQAESLANEIVWQDRPVTAHFVRPTKLADVPLRKPPAVTGDVRVIQVGDFDWSACGGTHVARSGEVGLIKIIKWERRGDETRVEFRCGRRALLDYRLKNELVNRVASGFNVGYWELDQAVDRLTAENKDLRSHLREAGRTLARYEATELRAAAPGVAGVRLVVCNLAARPPEEMRELARHLVSEPSVVALLGLVAMDDHKAQLCFARSSDVEVDMASLVRAAAATLGAGRGGGQPDFAQGGGPVEDPKHLDSALNWAARELDRRLTKAQDH